MRRREGKTRVHRWGRRQLFDSLVLRVSNIFHDRCTWRSKDAPHHEDEEDFVVLGEMANVPSQTDPMKHQPHLKDDKQKGESDIHAKLSKLLYGMFSRKWRNFWSAIWLILTCTSARTCKAQSVRLFCDESRSKARKDRLVYDELWVMNLEAILLHVDEF